MNQGFSRCAKTMRNYISWQQQKVYTLCNILGIEAPTEDPNEANDG